MSPQGGGRNAPEWVAGMNRNGRPEWFGTGGRNQSESVAGMRRNTHVREEGDVAPIYPLRIMDRGRCLVT